MKNLAFLIVVVANLSLFAQSKEYKVKAGEYPARIIKGDAYRFPEFRNGKLFQAPGKPSAPLLLNYNILFDEVRLINKQGDTLTVGDANLYPYIELGNSQLHHDPEKGYFEIIDGDNRIKLIEKQQFIGKQKDVVGSNGYGSTSSSPGSMVSATRTGSLPQSIATSVDVTYSREVFYYFLNGENKIGKANRSTLLKWFPDHREEIKNAIKEKNINFETEADLIKITKFVNLLK